MPTYKNSQLKNEVESIFQARYEEVQFKYIAELMQMHNWDVEKLRKARSESEYVSIYMYVQKKFKVK